MSQNKGNKGNKWNVQTSQTDVNVPIPTASELLSTNNLVTEFSPAEFLKKRALKEAELQATKTVKAKRSTERKLSKSNSVLLDILNSGLAGVTFEMIMANEAVKVDDNDKPNGADVKTVQMAWNSKDYTQRGELYLRAPWELDIDWKNLQAETIILQSDATEQTEENIALIAENILKMEAIEKANPPKAEVYFEISVRPSLIKAKKNNNHIVVADGSLVRPLKDYLLTVGAKETDFLVDDDGVQIVAQTETETEA